VYITDIYSIFVENSYKAKTLPVEAYLDLKIRYTDTYGRLFPTGIKGIEIDIQITNNKVLSVEVDEN